MTKKSIIDMTDTSPGAVERLLNNDLAGPWAMIVMIRALAAERDRLKVALKWALPLAELAQEDHRIKRLQAGHNDIGREQGHIGLWPEEVASRNQARAALGE